MSTVGIYILLLIVVLLIFISAFFSASETGMMALNRYRLRHLAKLGNVKASRVSKLLQRPDRLLGIILIGNTLCNVLASAIITYLVVTVYPNLNMFVVSLLLTFVLLVFAETAPKTLAAIFPQRIAFFASSILKVLLKIFYPLVVIINAIANALLKCFGVKSVHGKNDAMSAAELRSVVVDAKEKISSSYQQLLIRILELESVTVASILVPRSEIYGIDIQDDWSTIKNQLIGCIHSHIVVFENDVDHIKGMLMMRKVPQLLMKDDVSKHEILNACEAPYFVPESALLNRQLLNFQDQQRSISLVVDEYGDIIGLVTLKDIIEEIVGEFVFSSSDAPSEVKTFKDGSVLVEGRMSLRELNRQMDWQLPLAGSRTLSGLIVEYLEMIPQDGIGCRIAGYPIEVVKVEGNMVQLARVWPELARLDVQEFE